MLDLILTILFCWLLFKVLGLAFRVAWGVTKLIASLLLTIALPLLIVCLIFVGGAALLIPICLVAAAFCLLNSVL